MTSAHETIRITETPIRRRPDGSIDTAFHMARGRDARSRTVCRGRNTLIRIAAVALVARRLRHASA